MTSFYKKWTRRIIKIGIILFSVAILALRASVWYSERATEEVIPAVANPHSIIDPDLQEAIGRARSHFLAMKEERKIPGISIAVTVKNKLVWSEGAGFADLESKTPVTPETQFRVNSVSKLFTAALTMKLVEQGKVNLDEDVRHYVPDFPDKGHSITVRQLASHRSGIRGYRDDMEAVEIRNYHNVSESLEMFKNDPLAFEPGKDFLYSGFGYVLLSAALERAGQQDFLPMMNQEIFKPLKMENTHPAFPDSSDAKEARYYDNVSPYSPDGSLVHAPPNDFSFKWAAGGFVSTATDLTRFGNAHLAQVNENFFTNENLETLFEPQTTQAGILHYGLGWMSARDLHLRKACFHFGAGSGGTSLLAIYPGQQVCIALLSNLGHAKFSFDRLMGIANEFLYSPMKMIFDGWLVVILCVAMVQVYRKYSYKIKFLAK